MLSVGRREDGREGLGLGFGGGWRVRMEENEIEEGEAFSSHGDYTCLDPDSLSYIDEKLQDVLGSLGHYRNDFVGKVSADDLGAKFGCYGSFLPAYQRSPSVWPQPKIAPRDANQSVLPAEGPRQNSSVPMDASVSTNSNAVKSQSFDTSGKIGTSKVDYREVVPQHEPVNRQANNGDQKSLKVRIKLGPDSFPSRNITDIYSGLGLNISPSSSLEDTPDGSEWLPSEFRDVPDESPMAIIQIMACFSVPGGYLLSPLHNGLLFLPKKESTFMNCKSAVVQRGISESCAIVANIALPAGDAKSFVQKKMKPDEKIRRSKEVNCLDVKNDNSTILGMEIDNETPEGQKLIADALNISILSGLMSTNEKKEREIVSDSAKAASRTLEYSNEPNRISVIGRTLSPGIAGDNQLEFRESIKNSAVTSLSSKPLHLSGKLNSRTKLEEKTLEEKSTSYSEEASADLWREDIVKVAKCHDTGKSDTLSYKEKQSHVAGSIEFQKQLSAQKSTSYEQKGERLSLGKSQLPEEKRKLSESQTNGIPVAELTKENLKLDSSTKSKEKNKSFHERNGHSQNKSKTLKLRNKTSKNYSKESHRDATGDANAKQVQYKAEVLATDCEKDPEDVKLENGKWSVAFHGPCSKKVDNSPVPEVCLDAPVNAPLLPNAPNFKGSDTADNLQTPVVIKENWVACDICQLWRLLPYGTDPTNLPKKWQCSMQTWLPGLNRCYVSEKVTTKALNALYHIPAPESDAKLNSHHGVTVSMISSADALHPDPRREQNNQCVAAIGKKKLGLKDESNVKSRSLSNMNDYSIEMDFLSKSNIGHTSKLNEYPMEKHKRKPKEKLQVVGLCSDGGDFIEKKSKHSKSKSKREVDHNSYRSLKKVKKEHSHYSVENHLSTDNGFPSTAIMKNSQKYNDHSLSNDLKCDSKGYLPVSSEKSKNGVHGLPNGELKENFTPSSMKKCNAVNSSANKRKTEEWQASQGHQTPISGQHVLQDRVVVRDISIENEQRKQKKAKVSKSEGKESVAGKEDGKPDKVCLSRILPGSREHSVNGMDEERNAVGKEQLGHDLMSAITRRTLDCTDTLKQYMACIQPPIAATSSSSKVSSSRKSIHNFQEGRGSPVESVSSSPGRVLNTKKLLTKISSVGKDDATNVDFSIKRTPKRYSDGEFDSGSDRSATRMKNKASSMQERTFESHRAIETRALDLSRRMQNSKEANYVSSDRSKEHLKGGKNDLSLSLFEDVHLVNDTGNISDQYNKYYCEDPDKNILNRDKMDNRHHVNGSSERKSGKNSLRFKEKQGRSKSDYDKGKVKVSDVFREQKESHTSKVGSSFHSEADFEYHGHYTYQEDLRDGEKCNDQDRKNSQDNLEKNVSAVNYSAWSRRDGHSNYGMQDSSDACGASKILRKHEDFDLKAAGASCSKTDEHEKLQGALPKQVENLSSHLHSDRIDQAELASGKGKSQSIQPLKDKQEAHTQVVSTLVKRSRSDVNPTDSVRYDASKMVKRSRKPDSQNGLRQATPDCPDASSPTRRNGHPGATVALKEAIDLKHKANRLKHLGQEFESTSLYFEAALKFLHVASLMEPSNFESVRQGEATQSMKMYSETASLCEFCAHEYERSKDMAAAALAYKCVEVAYMKVAYYKHPSASKDRHELHAALLVVPPGDSPSSSASDVDNLNNQSALDKAASAKGTASPQIAGNHVIAARNRPNFLRLLNYTNDLNCAFEATRKSQNAITVAVADCGKERTDGMSSVKKALDFSFHNVEGLLRLVRLSMESISR